MRWELFGSMLWGNIGFFQSCVLEMLPTTSSKRGPTSPNAHAAVHVRHFYSAVGPAALRHAALAAARDHLDARLAATQCRTDDVAIWPVAASERLIDLRMWAIAGLLFELLSPKYCL
jgi:hypothetical protein